MARGELIKKYVIVVGVIIGIFALVAVAAFIVHAAVNNMNTSANDPPPEMRSENGEDNNGPVPTPPGSNGRPQPTPSPVSQPRITILLMGVDEHFNTDANLIMTFDPQNNAIDVISIPRDTRITLPPSIVSELHSLGRTTVPNNGIMRFGNLYAHAGSLHGPRFAARHLSAVFGIEIDNFVVLELAAFRKIVDFIDGVMFYVPRDMYYNPYDQDFSINLQQGMQRLDGAQAEGVVRYRSSLPRADLDRIEIQQDFMRAMFTQTLNSPEIRNNLGGAISTVFGTLTATDLVLRDVLAFIPVINALNNNSVTFHTIPGEAGAAGFFNYNINQGRTFFDGIFNGNGYAGGVIMNIKQRISGVVKAASGKAKQAYTHVKLDMKIKAYEDEIEQLKLEIGEIVYAANGQVNMSALEDHFEGIKTIENRLNRLRKRKGGILYEPKTDEKLNGGIDTKTNAPQFIGLERKDNDLHIGRVRGDISVLRYCAECGAKNNSISEQCEKCGVVLAHSNL